MPPTNAIPEEVAEEVTDGLRPPGPASASRWAREFPGEERQLAEVRRWLTCLLPDCPARDDLILVATELGTNAVRHTASGKGGRFAVELTWSGTGVRIAVTDLGAQRGPEPIRDPEGEDGRGLVIIEALASRIGVTGDRRGRSVWADLPWTGPENAPKPADDAQKADLRDHPDHVPAGCPGQVLFAR